METDRAATRNPPGPSRLKVSAFPRTETPDRVLLGFSGKHAVNTSLSLSLSDSGLNYDSAMCNCAQFERGCVERVVPLTRKESTALEIGFTFTLFLQHRHTVRSRTLHTDTLLHFERDAQQLLPTMVSPSRLGFPFFSCSLQTCLYLQEQDSKRVRSFECLKKQISLVREKILGGGGGQFRQYNKLII